MGRWGRWSCAWASACMASIYLPSSSVSGNLSPLSFCLLSFFFFIYVFSYLFILLLLSTLDVGNLGQSASACFSTFFECWSCKQLGWQLSCLSFIRMEMPTFVSRSGVTMRQSYVVVSSHIAPFYLCFPSSLMSFLPLLLFWR